MTIHEWFTSQVALRLGHALLHSLWQGTLLCAMAAAGLYLLRRKSAALRYAMLVCTLVAMIATPAATFLVLPRHSALTPASAGTSLSAPAQAPPVVSPAATGAEHPGALADPVHTAAALSPAASTQPWLDWLLPYAVATWGMGVVVLSLWNVGGWLALHRLRVMGTRPVSRPVQTLLTDLAQRMGIRRLVRIAESIRVDAPMLVGALRPLILMPPAMLLGLSTAQLQAVLAHELAHVRRYDYLVLLLQRLAETLLFYHPGIWWLSRRLQLEQEQCCDDLALAFVGDPRMYAGALAAVEEIRLESQPAMAWATAPALWATGSGARQLLRRIARLLAAEPPRNPLRVRASGAALAIFIATTFAIGSYLTVALTQAAPAPATAPIAVNEWSDPLDGLSTRIVIPTPSAKAGDPIPVHIEVRNSGADDKTFERPTEPINSTLIVRDDQGHDVPNLGLVAQIAAWPTKVGSHQIVTCDSFDLAKLFYLRRPGKYTVSWPGEAAISVEIGSSSLPATREVQFEILPNPAANADGDPVGHLLPLIKKGWHLAASPTSPEKLHPGDNFQEVVGWSFWFYSPHQTQMGPLIYLWLTDEAAAKQPAFSEEAPPSEYVGKAGHWHVYIYSAEGASKDWPTAKEDIARALSADLPPVPATTPAASSAK